MMRSDPLSEWRRIVGPSSPLALVILAGCILNLAVLASIRITAADPNGGDMCQGVIAARRLLAQHNPLTRSPAAA